MSVCHGQRERWGVLPLWLTWSPCVSSRGEEVSSLMTVVSPNRKRLVHSPPVKNLPWHPRDIPGGMQSVFERSGEVIVKLFCVMVVCPRCRHCKNALQSILIYCSILIQYTHTHTRFLFHVNAHVDCVPLLLWTFKLLMCSQWIPTWTLSSVHTVR